MTFPTDFCMIIDFRRDIAHNDFILLLIQKVYVNPWPDTLGRKILCLTSLVEVERVCFCNTEFFNQIFRGFCVFYPGISQWIFRVYNMICWHLRFMNL